VKSTRQQLSESRSTKDRGSRLSGPLGMPSHLPKPYSVHLSRQGLFLFRWFPPRSARQTLKHPPLRRVPERLWIEFVQLAEREDGEIRRFAEHWGPLRLSRRPSSATESVEEWRQFAILARALVRTDDAIRRDEPGRKPAATSGRSRSPFSPLAC
jgi:hypothetical protein